MVAPVELFNTLANFSAENPGLVFKGINYALWGKRLIYGNQTATALETAAKMAKNGLSLTKILQQGKTLQQEVYFLTCKFSKWNIAKVAVLGGVFVNTLNEASKFIGILNENKSAKLEIVSLAGTALGSVARLYQLFKENSQPNEVLCRQEKIQSFSYLGFAAYSLYQFSQGQKPREVFVLGFLATALISNTYAYFYEKMYLSSKS